MRHLLIGAALVIGLAVALTGVPGQAADADSVEKLVKQLSSGRFTEREKAQKKLESIGLPALDALRKAAETGDPETKRRAAELVSKLEKQATGQKVLAPTKVKLSYKDTPLKEAIADLTKQSGYQLTLVDPQNKIKDRKVTLETAEISFWEALDQFCARAGLVETDETEGQPVPPAPGNGGIIEIQGGGIQIQPNIIIRQQIQNVVPAPAPKKMPDDKPRPEEKKPEEKKPVPQDRAAPAKPQQKLNRVGALQFQAEEKVEKPVAPVKPQVAQKAQVQGKIQIGKPVQLPAVQPGFRRRPFRPQPQFQHPQTNQILLKDGTAKDAPTSYTGAVRVRTLEDVQRFGPVGDKEYVVGLKVSPEPKIRWQNLVNVRVDKAIDDQDQSLMPAMQQAGNGGQQVEQQIFPGGGRVIIIGGGARVIGGGFGGMPGGFPVQTAGLHQFVPVRLTKGEKPSRSLKELTGSLTAQVLAEPEVHITADDILKAAGKTFKGKDGGAIKVVGVTQNNGSVTLQLVFDQPRDVVPAGQPNVNVPVGGVPWNGPIQILPAPAPQILPQAQGAFQVQAAQIQIQQIQIGGGGIGFAPPAYPGNHLGLELLDEKGKVIPSVGYGNEGRANAGGGFEAIHHLEFKLQKDQKPAKLVFKGSKTVTVEIPFSLKNVKLP